MKTLFQHTLYNFIQDEENNTLIFDWTEKTSDMTDEDFIEALSNYVGFTYHLKGPGLLVDVTKFYHKLGQEAGKWRNEKGLPRYMAAGSYKIAYVFPSAALENLPKGDIKTGEFTDRYFDNRAEAITWLNS